MVSLHMGRLGWDPFAEMRQLQAEMNRLFGDIESRPAGRGLCAI